MKKNTEKLIPIIDFSKCVKCEMCIKACPHDVIKREDLNTCAKCIKYCITLDVPCKGNEYVFDYDRCDSCGKCIEACVHGAIKLCTEQKNLHN